jgi:hypothetical protein
MDTEGLRKKALKEHLEKAIVELADFLMAFPAEKADFS